MAAVDYTVRGAGFFCPSARLAGSMTPGTTTVAIDSFVNVGAEAVEVGSAAMIGSEIVKVVAFDVTDPTSLTVARGCGDTVPVAHAADEKVWLFGDLFASDAREYLGGETIGVKIQPFTTSGAKVELFEAPPNTVVFNWRFQRPYAPGLVTANTYPWWRTPVPVIDVATTPTLDLTWAHRDRVLQADRLVDQQETSIGPEPGTTYTIEIYDDADTLLRTVSGIADAEWTYPIVDAADDFGLTYEGTDDPAPGYLILRAERGGLTSLGEYRVYFIVDARLDTGGVGGWGGGWGGPWG